MPPTSGASGVSEVGIGGRTSGHSVEPAKVYTATQLGQAAAQVLQEINDSGRPAVVTRFGRAVALIQPLEGAVETYVLSSGPLAEEFVTYAKDDRTDDSYSGDQVRRMLKSHVGNTG